MIRIYYNPTTGEITGSISAKFASPFNQEPFIDIESAIRINEWQVDLEKKILVPKT